MDIKGGDDNYIQFIKNKYANTKLKKSLENVYKEMERRFY